MAGCCQLVHQDLRLDLAAVEQCEKGWEARAIVLGASAAFERRSLGAHQKRVFEAVQVLAADLQDAGVWHFAKVDDLAEAGIGSAGMEEVENR